VLDPQHQEQAVLSDQVPTPIGASATSDRILTDTEVPIQQLGQGELIWRRFRRHKLAMVGAVTLTLLILMAVFAPLISPEDYFNHWNPLAGNVAPRLAWPGTGGWKYLMGTDSQGHTLLMWITYGARVSLTVGVVSAMITSVIGIALGATAGYFGGGIDSVVMRITDVFLTIPTLPLLITLSFYLANGSMWIVIAIFGFTSWSGIARLVRAYYLTFRAQEFTEAARAVGVSDSRIIFRHILPNALSPVIVAATLAVAGFITGEAAIDFLGVGIKPPTVSWGLGLSNAEAYFGVGNWWWAFFPGMFILITVLAINFVGDGLRDALDVRARGE
jgi:ABC-type dipeptide/oligopeptide/nickel transport system permease subunit